MKVRKAVIPAAGFGTRVLPASKAIPKEMLPIVDKPAIHYIVEEAVQSGIEDILIIVSRGKSEIEDYFDHAPELEAKLAASGKAELLAEIEAISNMADIHFLRQKEQRGLGHAVLCARTFIGEEPFAVLYGDDVILSPAGKPATGELMAAYDKYGKGCVGIKQVPEAQIGKYSSLAVRELEPHIFEVSDMNEKPAPGEALSNYSILGRCLLTPEIFPVLETTAPGAGGEIQLTDAMKRIARESGFTGVEYTGKRYDMGNKLGILQANIEAGLAHPETGDGLREYLRALAKTL